MCVAKARFFEDDNAVELEVEVQATEFRSDGEDRHSEGEIMNYEEGSRSQSGKNNATPDKPENTESESSSSTGNSSGSDIKDQSSSDSSEEEDRSPSPPPVKRKKKEKGRGVSTSDM